MNTSREKHQKYKEKQSEKITAGACVLSNRSGH
jgi:hypothetical protein